MEVNGDRVRRDSESEDRPKEIIRHLSDEDLDRLLAEAKTELYCTLECLLSLHKV